MGMRTRKLIGTLILVVGLIAYILIASVIATSILPDNVLVQLIYYAIAGIVWVFPVRGLMLWMNRPD